ncbi:MAG: hypothetical protein ACYCQJ_10215 [Nitrososphaerales archaeon]
MVSYGLAVLVIGLGTLLPAYLALYLITRLKFLQTKTISALGLGLSFFFLIDTFNDASELDVNSAFYPDFGGWYHVSLILAFLFGIVALAIFDHFGVPKVAKDSARTNLGLVVLAPIAVAAVMGIHSFAEGWSFASVASGVPGNDLVNAFAPGIPTPAAYEPLISYPVHKFLEASIVACLYVILVQRNKNVSKAKWHLPLLGLLFGFTSVIGASIGYFFSFDLTYFYAFGVTAAIYAIIRLAEGITKGEGDSAVTPSYLGAKVFLGVSAGFFLLYVAALLH